MDRDFHHRGRHPHFARERDVTVLYGPGWWPDGEGYFVVMTLISGTAFVLSIVAYFMGLRGQKPLMA